VFTALNKSKVQHFSQRRFLHVLESQLSAAEELEAFQCSKLRFRSELEREPSPEVGILEAAYTMFV